MAFDFSGAKKSSGVNVAECLRVADLVERSTSYNQQVTHHMCGTPACIAGHAVGHGLQSTCDPAQRLLGLNDAQALALFNWAPLGGDVRITNAHAATCLRHLAASGEPGPTTQAEMAESAANYMRAMADIVSPPHPRKSIEDIRTWRVKSPT